MADELPVNVSLTSSAKTDGVDKMNAALQRTEAQVGKLDNAHGKLDAANNKAAKSSGSMGNALLQSSRAIQDAQYGLSGVVNNLEGIASALGLGAGVAGVVTVLAVAVQTLGPAVVDWFKSLDTEGAKLDKLKERFAGFAEELRGKFSPETQRAQELTASHADELKREADAIAETTRALDAYLAQLRLKNQIQAAADKNLEAQRIADIEGTPGLDDETKRRQIAAAKQATLDAQKAREEQTAREEEAAALQKFKATENALARDTQTAAQRAQDLRDTQTAAAFLDPKNKGSITGIDEQIRVKNASLIHERTVGMETGSMDNKRIAEIEREIEQLRAVQTERQAFVDTTTTRTGGASADQIAAALKASQEEVARLQKELQAAAENFARTRSDNALRAVGRDSTFQFESQQIQREAGLLQNPGDLPPSSPLFDGSVDPANPLGGAPRRAMPRSLAVPLNPSPLDNARPPVDAAPITDAARSIQESAQGADLQGAASAMRALGGVVADAFKGIGELKASILEVKSQVEALRA